MRSPFNSFESAWHPDSRSVSRNGDLYIISRPGGDILVPRGAQELFDDFSICPDLPDSWPCMKIGAITGTQVHAFAGPPNTEPPDGMEWRSPRTLFAALEPAMVEGLSRASMIASWEWDHRYCGRCGTATLRDAAEAARVCPSCGYRAYPRVSPAMITLIEASAEAGFNEPRILLAHNRRFPEKVYSCVAGYVDAGETLESTVLREIKEEVGLDAAPPRYFKSQSWPLPHSLMLGFVTTAEGTPVPDGVEIEDAQWFAADDLPHIPRQGTIARCLIDDWLQRIGAPEYDESRRLS